MTAPERLTIHGPEDILGFIPHSLGYWPESSLVAMTLHGTTLGATLRLDLPGPQAGADPCAYARAVRRYLESDGEADGSLLAIFGGDSGTAVPPAYRPLLAQVRSVLDQAGMPVREAWYVGDQYWRDAFCTEPSCCPFPGRPVQQIRDSRLNTEMVYRGSSVGPAPRNSSVPAPAVSSLHLAAVRGEEAAWAEKLGSRTADRVQFHAVLDCWEALLRMPETQPWLPEVERDAFLRATLLYTGWRDAVLIMAAAGRRAAEAGAEDFGTVTESSGAPGLRPRTTQGGTLGEAVAGPPVLRLPGPAADPPSGGRIRTGASGRAMRLHKEGSPGGEAVPGWGEILMGVAPQLPDWSCLDKLDRVFEQLAALGGQPAAAALTGRGWISWCRGRGSYAAAYLEQALELDPQYRLAELLLELVARGGICGWAKRKEAAWQSIRDEPAPRG
ncbi:MAG: DUF4192 domain-containing protein [Pseudarthrobacter sp.]|nr:DUF4192 domain-containing protein [Pseudarthrobacter sp.]